MIEQWNILDNNENPTGEIMKKYDQKYLIWNYIIQVSYVWIINNENKILIQKKSEQKRLELNVWAMTGDSVILGEESERNNGIGKALIENAINYAKDNNCEVVELTSYKENIKAHNLMSNNYIVVGYSITYEIGDFESGGWSAMFKNFIVNKDDSKVCNNYYKHR